MSEDKAVEPVAPDVGESVTPNTAEDPQNSGADSIDGSASTELLQKKLGFANSQAAKAKKEAEQARKQLLKFQSELDSIRENQQSAERKSLEKQGAFKELYETEKQRSKTLETRLLNETADLRNELESVTQSANQERIKSKALSAISQSNAINPQQMYMLLEPILRQNDDGNLTVLNGGIEQLLNDYLGVLKQSTEWQHHFAAGSSRGMGAAPINQASNVSGITNPYIAGNTTEVIKLEVENPELARVLKAEALKR